ncbi:MAG: glycoside hydrolase, partial [Clostridia bacterium]|nr:glycoside hydrolase [Clostridia bacterium]
SVEGGHVFYRRSDDDGKTWSEPRDVMASTRPDFHNVFACGPGHGIVTRSGTLLVPVWMVPKEANAPVRAHSPAVISTFVSENHGDTWYLGEIIPPTASVREPNETAAAELTDGRIYLNVRAADAGYRAVTYSPDGTSGWSSLTLDRALPDPTCFGSVAGYRHNETDAILCVNCASQTERENLVCRASFDGGAIWSRSLTVEPGNAGYADIAVLPDGTVCVMYEQDFGTVERLARFSLDELR